MNWEESSLAWIRRAKDPEDFVVIATNFTPVPRLQHRIGLPKPGRYREIFNSDSHRYDGSNVGNAGNVGRTHHHGPSRPGAAVR